MPFTARCVTTACTSAIVGGIVATLLAGHDLTTAEVTLSVIAVVVACMVLCTAAVITEIRKVNRPADHAWLDGYDTGFDKGWLERGRKQMGEVVQFPDRHSLAQRG